METAASLPADLQLPRESSVSEITEEPAVADSLVRTLSYPRSANHHRRRIGAGKPASVRRPFRQQSLRREIGHAAAETYLMTRLTFKLLGFLGLGYRWITKLLALCLYAILLLPGFLQVGYQYFFSSHVLRSIVYGDQPRNRLDLYLPRDSDTLRPVVIFVTGGAWIIGYKAWGSLLGLQLAERDIIVACLDYRNFPQGTISDMVHDVSEGISYVFQTIVEYGGDPNKIYLMGQSAGAHISSCALLAQAVKESRGESISWRASQINAFLGLSGGYNLFKLIDHFNSREATSGITFYGSIMEGEKSLGKFSPEILVKTLGSDGVVSLLPHIVLFHGTADYSIPSDASTSFVDALRGAGAHADLVLYDGKTHTDLFLQDPLRGGKDELFDYLVGFIHSGDDEALERAAAAPPRKRFVPEILLKFAGQVSPF